MYHQLSDSTDTDVGYPERFCCHKCLQHVTKKKWLLKTRKRIMCATSPLLFSGHTSSDVIGCFFLIIFLNVSYTHQDCIYLIKHTVKIVILQNVFEETVIKFSSFFVELNVLKNTIYLKRKLYCQFNALMDL